MAALLRMASQGFRCTLKHLSFSMIWVACLLLYDESEEGLYACNSMCSIAATKDKDMGSWASTKSSGKFTFARDEGA